MRRLLLPAALAAFLIAPAAASAASGTVTIAVSNQTHAPARLVLRIERAVSQQANGAFRRAWQTPRVRFVNHPASGAWQLQIVPQHVAQQNCGEIVCWGWHGVSPAGVPLIVVSTANPDLGETFSHETLETLVDPMGDRTINGQPAEVCDPVNTDSYMTPDGVSLADYVLPGYFAHAHGWADAMDLVKG